MVLGLEAVLADGTIVSSMNRLIKNNTGRPQGRFPRILGSLLTCIPYLGRITLQG